MLLINRDHLSFSRMNSALSEISADSDTEVTAAEAMSNDQLCKSAVGYEHLRFSVLNALNQWYMNQELPLWIMK